MARKKIRRGLVVKKNTNFIKNFSSLTALQISNYLFPLIIFPYLVRVLGIENFGTANFVFAFITYFAAFTEYGFNLSATRQISINRNNHVLLQEIFNSTLLIKTFLCIISFIILFCVTIIFEQFGINSQLYFISFLFVAGNVFYPDWFLQGVEKMSYLAFVTIPMRIISTAAVFLFVTSAKDLSAYIIIVSIYQFVVGLLLYIVTKNKFSIKFSYPGKKILFEQLRGGWYIFLSKISINIYTSSNVFLLGVLTGNLSVGYFTGANKIREAVSGIFSNIGLTFYPYFSERFQKNKNEGLKSLITYLKFTASFSFIPGVLFFIFSEEIILFILGKDYLSSIEVLKILAFLPFIISLSNVLGIQLMLNNGYTKEFNKIISAAAFINLILIFLLVTQINEKGAALSMLITEIFVTVSMGIFVIRRKLFDEI